MKNRFREHTQNPRRQKALEVREKLEAHVRTFFSQRGFRETRTPTLVRSPGMEPHIRPFAVHRASNRETFLHTSPEFAMKKLMVGGLEKIFQISTVFRDEPVSNTHLPEFNMLEWYRVGASCEDLMKDVESLFFEFSKQISLPFELKKSWPRLTTAELFEEFADVDLPRAIRTNSLSEDCLRLEISNSEQDSFDDQYFRIWLNKIEPQLPKEACFVTHYPPSQAALAKTIEVDGVKWADRFEVYVGGLELANAFNELTDAKEQKKRFLEDIETRKRTYGEERPLSPIDDEFIEALEVGLPDSAGIALGLDRMVMLFAGEEDIRYTVWLHE